MGFLYVSSLNYPGGEAFALLHDVADCGANVRVHVGVEAAITGVTRFGEIHPTWIYSKAENLKLEDYNEFSYLITGNRTIMEYLTCHDHENRTGIFHVGARVAGFDQILKSFPPKIISETKIWILENGQLCKR
eukprot:TRINITY_DN6026_c0_g1_i3.p2 TRINITY_DN6026_c0_g1~~TRINITY_DN6026_c0_g1_i3.p2  ORF type:complete len:133 (-),score=29.86 TRINITY_DN6026_c0_g1_i3:365-763(-)